MKGYYRVIEEGYIIDENNKNIKQCNDNNLVKIDSKVFNELEELIIKDSFDNKYNITNFMTLGYKKGIGNAIKIQNYVGLIQTRSGAIIEILPKIYIKNKKEQNIDDIKKILLKMINSLEDFPFKQFNRSNLDIKNIKILDIFIKMFLEELSLLIKRGLRSDYIISEENAIHLKGKLLISKHIKNNLFHKERFYIEYNELSKNRPENKIIKSTLQFLKDKTNNNNIKILINEYLLYFDGVEYSRNYKEDLNKCVKNRLMSDYDTIIKWCKIFLNQQSFFSFSGTNISYSILFPMEKLFESYVAKIIKEALKDKDCNVLIQHKKYHLIEEPEKKFKLIPDIVIEKCDSIVILDTKWKILSDDKENVYGISQSDLYQMYAYSKKYKSNRLILLYPMTEKIDNELKRKSLQFFYDKDVELDIEFVDLNDIEDFIYNLTKKYIYN